MEDSPFKCAEHISAWLRRSKGYKKIRVLGNIKIPKHGYKGIRE